MLLVDASPWPDFREFEVEDWEGKVRLSIPSPGRELTVPEISPKQIEEVRMAIVACGSVVIAPGMKILELCLIFFLFPSLLILQQKSLEASVARNNYHKES